jgi:hypothetical protein
MKLCWGNHVVGRFAISSKTIGLMGREPIPAAQYVRMSTEHQRYSTENQSDAILQYAVHYGFDIVRTYADNGKSGLRLDSRDALKQLLIDVEGGSPGFKAVLVYDASTTRSLCRLFCSPKARMALACAAGGDAAGGPRPTGSPEENPRSDGRADGHGRISP